MDEEDTLQKTRHEVIDEITTQENLSNIRSLKQELINRPEKFIQKRLANIQSRIDCRGKNPRLVPSKPGNKTMYQKLLDMKEECVNTPELVINKLLSKVNHIEADLSKSLEEVDILGRS